MPFYMAFGAKCEIDESMLPADTTREGTQKLPKFLDTGSEAFRAFAGKFNDAVCDQFRLQRGIQLWSRWLYFCEAELGELLHRPVDFRGRYPTLAADSRGVRNAENHKSSERWRSSPNSASQKYSQRDQSCM